LECDDQICEHLILFAVGFCAKCQGLSHGHVMSASFCRPIICACSPPTLFAV
jgi:hypothetical protein